MVYISMWGGWKGTLGWIRGDTHNEGLCVCKNKKYLVNSVGRVRDF